MNWLERISLCLLKLRRRPQLSRTQDSIATPLGHVPYRHVNPQASLSEGVARARLRRYYRPEVHDE